MEFSPILACGPNMGLLILVCAVYGGIGAGGLSFITGITGALCMFKGKKTVGGWLVSFAILFAVIAVSVFLWVKSL